MTFGNALFHLMHGAVVFRQSKIHVAQFFTTEDNDIILFNSKLQECIKYGKVQYLPISREDIFADDWYCLTPDLSAQLKSNYVQKLKETTSAHS